MRFARSRGRGTPPRGKPRSRGSLKAEGKRFCRLRQDLRCASSSNGVARLGPAPEAGRTRLNYPGSTPPPRVSIVIPVYNHCHETIACLESIAEHTKAIPHEVIVVDDCS